MREPSSESEISLADEKGEPLSPLKKTEIGKSFTLNQVTSFEVAANGTKENYQQMKNEMMKLDQQENVWDRSCVKESEWPVELFYNKTVNTFKKKQQFVGTSEVNWALEFTIMNEYEHNCTSMDVHYKCDTWEKKDPEKEEMVCTPVRREVKLHPSNVCWNER